jgi:hypothetical protein
VAHEDERPSEAPPGKLAFRDRCSWGDFAVPDLVRVAEEARWLAEPAAAAVASFAWRGGEGEGWLVTPTDVESEDAALIMRWLGTVEGSSPIVVPVELRRKLGCVRALAVPMQGLHRRVGAMALPLRAGWGPMARELEGLGSDFAMRLEAAEMRAHRLYGRTASVGRRPVGRRSCEPGVTVAPERVLGHRAAPRPRVAHPDGTRRADAGSSVLGREGALALGRR